MMDYRKAMAIHGGCVFLGWIIGSQVAAWLAEILVACGVREMDFSLFDWPMRIFAFVGMEFIAYEINRRFIRPTELLRR